MRPIDQNQPGRRHRETIYYKRKEKIKNQTRIYIVSYIFRILYIIIFEPLTIIFVLF